VTGASLASQLGLKNGANDWLVMRDARSGLEYLHSQHELTDHGLRLTLHAYETQLYTELRDLVDSDGRYGRLAAWLNGRGVPSLDDALVELELEPLHDALRAADEQAALAQVAALLELEPAEAALAPGEKRAKAAPDEMTLARSIETFVAANKKELARGKWIYDWHLGRVWPQADLIALKLDLEARPRGRANGRKPAALLADDRFRRSIGVNEHDGETYFNRERFEDAVSWLDLPEAPHLKAAAKKSDYRLDALAKLLDPPNWASTTPVPAAAATARKVKATPRQSRAEGG
jgi:hypothetical protein